MKLTRTPAQQHDYNIKLTRKELIAMGNDFSEPEMLSSYLDVMGKVIMLAQKEVERLGSGE